MGQDYRKIEAWKVGHELVLGIHTVSRGFPRDERFGVTSQVRRAAVSIAASTAEGAGRATPGEFGNALSDAIGSCNETDYLLLLASEPGYGDQATFAELRRRARRVRGMLISFRRRVLAPRPGSNP